MDGSLRIACPNCGKETIIDGKCSHCGYVLWDGDSTKAELIMEERKKAEALRQAKEMRKNMACPHCGSHQINEDGFCRNCGYVLADDDQQQLQHPYTEQPMGYNHQTPVQSPNLANCPDCGHVVSMFATSCPGCGRPLVPLKQIPKEEDERPTSKSSNGFGVFLAIVFGIVVAVWIISKIFHVEITGTLTPMK